jgi:hypothetical protein
MRIAEVVAVVVAALAAYPTGSFAGAPEAFEQLKMLAGEWEADLPGFGKINSSVRVVSGGKAVEETIGTPAENELSVYTLNNDRILLTHFCAMTADGHQVRLQTSPLASAPDRLDFDFESAINLHDKMAPHMRRVVMHLSDHDHYSAKWTKTENGKETIFDLKFVRR